MWWDFSPYTLVGLDVTVSGSPTSEWSQYDQDDNNNNNDNNKTSTSQVGKMARPILKASLSSEYLTMERRLTWIWKTTGGKMKKIQILKESLIFQYLSI